MVFNSSIKYLFTILLLSTVYLDAHGQDVVSTRSERAPLDTNLVVYDEHGSALHFYQYTKLINTGEYTIRSSGPPGTPGVKSYLKKLNQQDILKFYKIIAPHIAIKSRLLQEGNPLDITPLLDVLSKDELNNKVIVLLFWNVNCPPCTENFASLNDFFKQIYEPSKVVVIAITADDETVADAKLKEKPLLYAKLLSNAGKIENSYQLNLFPSYVVADRERFIRFAVSGSSLITIPAFKSVIRSILMQ